MSKRAGTVVTLEDLVEAIGVDAARYALARSSHRLAARHRHRPVDPAAPATTRSSTCSTRTPGSPPAAQRRRARPRPAATLRPRAARPRARGRPAQGARRVPAGGRHRGRAARAAPGRALPRGAGRHLPPLLRRLPGAAARRRGADRHCTGARLWLGRGDPRRCSPTASACSASPRPSGCSGRRCAPTPPGRGPATSPTRACTPARPPTSTPSTRGLAARPDPGRRGLLALRGLDVRDLAAEHGTPGLRARRGRLPRAAAATSARRSPARRLLRRQGVPLHGGRALGRRGGPRPRRLHRRRARGRARGRLPRRADRVARQQQVGSPSWRAPSTPASAGSSSTRSTRSTGCAGCRAERGVRQRVLVRVTVGVEAHTHEFIATAHEDQKFGFSLAGGAAARGRPPGPRRAGRSSWSACTRTSARRSSTPPASRSPRTGSSGCSPQVRDEHGVELPELDLGGGFGIAYTTADDPADVADLGRPLRGIVERECAAAGLAVPAALGRARPGDRRAGAPSRSTRSARSRTRRRASAPTSASTAA